MDYFAEVLSVKWLVSACFNTAVGAILFWAFKDLPRIGMRWVLGGRVKRLKKIKRMRFNSVAVNYELVKAGAYFVLFLSSVVLTLCLIVFTSRMGAVQGAYVPIVVSIYASPVFVFEILWLEQNFLVMSLIRYSPYSHKGKKCMSRSYPRSARRDKQRALRRRESNAMKYRPV